MSSRMLVLALILILSACSSKPYDYDTAIDHGDIVDLHGNLKNIERLEEFYQNLLLKNKDKIRITRFTIEGDPIFNDLEFDGNEIKYNYDNSKDKFGKTNKRSTTCKSLKITKIENGIEYSLEGCYGKNKEIGENFKFLVVS
jgi:hypothetical protein